MKILVFKTNVEDRQQVLALIPHLETIDGILKWNVDLHDNDRVLRVESKNIAPSLVEEIITGAGYYCKELED